MPTPTLTQSIVITLIQCLLVVIFVFVVVLDGAMRRRRVTAGVEVGREGQAVEQASAGECAYRRDRAPA